MHPCNFVSFVGGLRSPRRNGNCGGRAITSAGEGGASIVATAAAAEKGGDGVAAEQPSAHAGSVLGEVLLVADRRGGPELLRVLRQL